MRTVPAVLVAAMLVLAGCGMGGNGTTGTPTASTSDANAVPGVSDGRLVDSDALLSAHVDELTASGYETRIEINATEQFRGSRYDASRVQQTVVEPGGEEYVYRLTDRRAGARFETWGNDSVRLTRARIGNTTQIQQGAGASPATLAGTRVMRPFLNATAFEVESVQESGDLTLVTLVDTGTPSADAVGVVPRNATDVREYEVRVVADTSGRILVFEASADYTIAGETGSMSITAEVIRDDGPAVERPAWADEALAS